MFINKKLKDNIITSILNRISYASSESDSIESLLEQSIDEAMEETWDDMSLAERCGPGIWDFLSWIARVADNEGKPDLYIKALEVVQEGHPCKEICRPHVEKNLIMIDSMTYDSCFEHLHAFHNIVNQQLGKEQFPMYKAISKYDLDCDSCIFDPVGKSHSQQSSASVEYNQTLRKDAEIKRTRNSNSQYNTRGGKIHQTTGAKGITADSWPIYTPSTINRRVRNTNIAGVHPSRRGHAPHY